MAGMTDGLQKMVGRSRPDSGAPVLYFSWPRPELRRFRANADLFINTMWEASRLPPGWASALNDACAVVVPTTFVADVCRASGVKVPIEVVPQGVDPQIYHQMERSRRAGLTTLIVGTVIGRKHVREGIAAWKAAFGTDPEARLIIKSRFHYGNYTPDDSRITFLDSNRPSRGIADLYREADVLLALGNEGFGLPLVEGMATGLPVIALDSEGQSDVCREAKDLVLPISPVAMEPCNDTPFGPGGRRGVPDVEQVAARLHWVATHRDEARDMGRQAARWVRQNRCVWTMGPGILDVMESHVRPKRPLSRRRTLWVPSWQTPCGVAEYTRHLAEHLIEDFSKVRVCGGRPEMRSLSLLHIQHEHSLLTDGDMARAVSLTKHHGVPVVVTEHSVNPCGAPWESEADALVAVSRGGARRLSERHPSKRVVHIPHGCPTWFPPRKSRRGRTIGVFGFLEQHKGFWAILDVLRRLPGTDLLMFSHAKSPAIEARWKRDSAGLPVRRIGDFLPPEKTAYYLAANSDILVFWYDEVAHASASGAVCIGLATGVPVLTSQVGWFDDVRDATHQPADLFEGVARLLDDTALRDRLTAAARDYCHGNSWRRTAARHKALWDDL
jgi:glycosyltransferase involved in cell wall biosynthesis